MACAGQSWYQSAVRLAVLAANLFDAATKPGASPIKPIAGRLVGAPGWQGRGFSSASGASR
jgi:hypothetical protein